MTVKKCDFYFRFYSRACWLVSGGGCLQSGEHGEGVTIRVGVVAAVVGEGSWSRTRQRLLASRSISSCVESGGIDRRGADASVTAPNPPDETISLKNPAARAVSLKSTLAICRVVYTDAWVPPEHIHNC